MNESETDQIVFPKYFLSETILTTKNGGRGTHFAKFLISPFQWGLTHSALVVAQLGIILCPCHLKLSLSKLCNIPQKDTFGQ